MEVNKNSILDYIGSRTDNLSANIQQESKQMKALLVFFQTVKKDIDQLSKSLQKSIIVLKGSLIDSSEIGNCIQNLLLKYTNVSKALSEYGSIIESELTKSFDTFILKYEQMNNIIISKASKILYGINNKKQMLKKIKTKYFKDSKTAMGCTNEESYKNKSKIANDSKKDYLMFINYRNIEIAKSKVKYENLLKTWYSNEECKMSYIKKLLVKFHDSSINASNDCLQLYIALKKMSEDIECTLNIKRCIPIQESTKNKTFDKFVFEQAPTDKSFIVNDKDTEELLANIVSDADIDFAISSVKSILEDEAISKPDFEKLLNVVKTDEGQKAICKIFSMITKKQELENKESYECLKSLAEVIIIELSGKKFPNCKFLSGLLSLGGYVAYYNSNIGSGKCKEYLRNSILDKTVWRGKDIWTKILNYRITKGVKQLQAYTLLKIEQEKDSKMQRKKSDAEIIKQEEQQEAGKRGIAFAELSFVSMEMAFYSINSNTSRSIITEVSREWSLEIEKIYQLMTDYESAQIIPRDEEPREKEILRHSLEKAQRQRDKCKNLRSVIILRLTLKYIPDITILIRILGLNKYYYTKFRSSIYRIALLKYSDRIRFQIWKNILYSKGFTSLYEKLKEKRMKEFIENKKETNDIINLDIIRAFPGASNEEKDSMASILRCYAVTNPEVEYCQGMNFIAGMFYMISKDEALSFTMLCTLIDNFNLSNLFKHDVPLLRTYFYKMNRLLALFIPKLHIHFFEEGINVSYFSSSWFITIFTYIIEFTKDQKIPRLLLLIFDGFLTKGIQSLFKSSLFILTYHQEKFLKMNYEEITKLLRELPSTDFFSNIEVEKIYKETIKDFNISKELLDKLDEEHIQICVMCKERKNSLGLPKHPFKHYIKANDKIIPVYISN